MFLNHSSLMLAIAFSGVSLSITLFASWLSSRTENFLLTWAIGTVFVVLSAGGFSYYTQHLHPLWALGAMSCLDVGLAIVYGAGRQFRTRRFPFPRVAIAAGITVLPMAVLFPWGYDGLGMIAANLGAALLLFATTAEYWLARRQAPVSIAGLIVLYAATGVSFTICALAIALDTPVILAGPPQNWAENLNAVISIISVTGIGAISLALHQSRLALRHKSDARTDSLTGLMNRRALFDKHGSLPKGASAILFDLDYFKDVNDAYGHDVGDKVLRRFSDVVRDNLRPDDSAARLGGEEFALVMPRCNSDIALMMAEGIRTMFEAEIIETDSGALACTVSAGLAVVDEAGETLDAVLRRADGALYLAKREGRNRVRAASDETELTSASVLHLPVQASGTGGR